MTQVPQIAQSPQTPVEELLNKIKAKANKDPKAFNAFDVIAVFEAIRVEYNEAFDEVFEQMKNIAAEGLGDVELVERGQKIVGQLVLFLTGLLKGSGALDDQGKPTSSMPADVATSYEALAKEASEFLTEAEAYLEDADDDFEGEGEGEDESGEGEPVQG